MLGHPDAHHGNVGRGDSGESGGLLEGAGVVAVEDLLGFLLETVDLGIVDLVGEGLVAHLLVLAEEVVVTHEVSGILEV